MITKINHKHLISLLFIIYTLVFSEALTSCSDFLDIKPQSEIILEDFWNEKADVDNVVMGCYSALQGDAVRRRMMIWGEARSENVMSGMNINNDVSLYNILKENITAMNAYTTWDGFYDVINRCNTVLKYAPGVAAIDPGYTQGDLRATIAEVKALRDLCYFYLIRTFRNVPYSTEAFTDDDQKMDLPATPFYDVLDSLINDLESVKGDAVVRYPETQPRYQTGRITRDAIYAMLCEMYLWKQDYNSCIRYAELVIQSLKDAYEENRNKNTGGRTISGASANYVDSRLNGYPLVADATSGNFFGEAYETIFCEGESRETIFELNTDESPEANGYPSNSAVATLYGHATANKGLLAASTIITDDIATSSGRSVFEDKNKFKDMRLYQNCDPSNGNIVKYATGSLMVNASGIDNATKPVDPSYGYYTEKNNSSQWIIYRLPDIMLLEAEALCQQMQEGNEQSILDYNAPLLEKAFTLVNAVNKRAICKTQLVDADTLKPADYNTKNLMDELVKRERQRELMFEGKRWYDLVRYAMRDGNTLQVVAAVMKRDDVNASFAQNFFKKMDAIFWPYNSDEMKVNRNLEPNPVFGSGESTSYEKSK